MQRFSSDSASPADTYPHARFASARARPFSWLTTRSRSLESRSRTCAAAHVMRFRFEYRLSLRCSSKISERISCSKSAARSRCPCGSSLGQPRMARFERRVQLHQRLPFRAARRARFTGKTHQNAAQHARQIFAALRIATDPEEEVGNAAGQIGDAAIDLNRQVARTLQRERIHRRVRKHPGVFAAAAALHRNDAAYPPTEKRAPARPASPPTNRRPPQDRRAARCGARAKSVFRPHRRRGKIQRVPALRSRTVALRCAPSGWRVPPHSTRRRTPARGRFGMPDLTTRNCRLSRT